MQKRTSNRSSRKFVQLSAGRLSRRSMVFDRSAHVVTRAYPNGGTGSVLTSGAGAIASISGLATGTLAIGPEYFGAQITDLAAHFAYWKLHRVRLVYVNNANVTNTSVSAPVFAGTIMLGISDDSASAGSTTSGNIMELRSSGEYRLDRDFVFDYTPTGRSADWLFTSRLGGATSENAKRFVDAGVLVFQAGLSSSWLNTVVGRMHFELDVSFKGARQVSGPTMLLADVDAKEERKSVVHDILTAAAAKDEPRQGAKASQLPAVVQVSDQQDHLAELCKLSQMILQRQPGAGFQKF